MSCEQMAAQKKRVGNNCMQSDQIHCKPGIVAEMNVEGLSCWSSYYCDLCHGSYCSLYRIEAFAAKTMLMNK